MPSQTSATIEGDELETWENITRSRFVLKRFNQRGDLVDEMIGSNKTFHLTTRERRINQELVAATNMDPFANGTFSPVRILDTVEDYEEIASNPNILSESDMVGLVKGKLDVLRKRLENISNPVLLKRLGEVANEQDATVGKVAAINERLGQVSPSLHVEIETSVSN